jgi:hypothetical protein
MVVHTFRYINLLSMFRMIVLDLHISKLFSQPLQSLLRLLFRPWQRAEDKLPLIWGVRSATHIYHSTVERCEVFNVVDCNARASAISRVYRYDVECGVSLMVMYLPF